MEALLRKLTTLPAEPVAGFPVYVEQEQVWGRFFKCRIGSRFTPVTGQGFATVRAQTIVYGPDEQLLPVERLFDLAQGEEALLKLDRLCRLVHALNHFCVQQASGGLQLDIHPRLFHYVRHGHGQAYAHLLHHFGIPTQRITLVLPSEALWGLDLTQVLTSYRQQGFGVLLLP